MPDNNDSRHHISKPFDQELEDIRRRIQGMGELVEEQVKLAIKALEDRDAHLARRVVVNDAAVNSLESSIDEECTQILARRQPTARDLRLVLAVIKTTVDLERIGDEAKLIAHRAIDLSNQLPDRRRFAEQKHLAAHVGTMLRNALDAFDRMDVEQAFRVMDDCKSANVESESVMRQQVAVIVEDQRSIPACLDIMWSTRAMERIGERCCNICEYVVYYTLGKDIRHLAPDDARNAIEDR
ncbi:phosphate signaling complex protein PhoU [Methylogaea oryzae]|uniref:Phosphate-specific transport system accessory protein PhoU n=1 Tax=Methylogaea oryzae TaxID=1295382 RepID=A0A8D5ALI8_9GAMM|nr:phosphate signaling complex protein PhoU [Methylogaea oryzae]BBL72166.1 phosphate transport system regulatory protein PhoU [Methylogaea oryzae]